ncbi:MAG: CBS domain-containing protein, partial [Thermodesulfovibrionales bacterium]|nr:CBS domain-containing protein [Thermodesulfovibrionales bacterium]
MLNAKNIMTRNVTTVRTATTIEELARTLMGHKISGVPVVNDAGDLIGIVTENDLISRDKRL